MVVFCLVVLKKVKWFCFEVEIVKNENKSYTRAYGPAEGIEELRKKIEAVVMRPRCLVMMRIRGQLKSQRHDRVI